MRGPGRDRSRRRWRRARCRRGTPIRRIGHFPNERRLTHGREDDDRAVGQRRRAGRQRRRICRRRRSTATAGISASPTPCSRCRRTTRFLRPARCPYQYFEVPTNFTEDRWIQAWEFAPGNPRRRAPRDRVRAAAAAAGAQPPQARPPAAPGAPRPPPLFSFADGTEIPAGQSGGRTAARGSAPSRPARTIGRGRAARAGRRRLRAWQFDARLPGGHGDAPAGRPLARASRCTTRRSARRRPIARASALISPPSRRRRRCRPAALINGGLRIPAGAAESPRRRRDDDQPRHHALQHDRRTRTCAAWVALRSDVSGRPQGSRSCRCRSTTSTGSTTTSSRSR